MFKNLIPKVFYDHLQDGLEFSFDDLGFEVFYQDAEMADIASDGAKAATVKRTQYTAMHRRELGIDIDAVDKTFKEMSTRSPDHWHPNSSAILLKPWGACELPSWDRTTVCVSFRQWPAEG